MRLPQRFEAQSEVAAFGAGVELPSRFGQRPSMVWNS
jgi:hypothetical protein